jgi:BCD family chlorophyll transporter-like MFS transporter
MLSLMLLRRHGGRLDRLRCALADFSQLRLIQVIQGAGVLVLALNCIALWKQEPRGAARRFPNPSGESLPRRWRVLRRHGGWTRRLLTLGLGSAGFAMQDVLLEPMAGRCWGLSVVRTTAADVALRGRGAAGLRRRGPCAGAGRGCAPAGRRRACWPGVVAVSAVLFSAPLESVVLFASGTILIGFGNALFAVGTLIACMRLAAPGQAGLVLGVWGSVQATAAGIAMGFGGVLRDAVAALAATQSLGEALTGPAIGYGAVYLIEITLLFVTLAAIGPLVGTRHPQHAH